ncbi:hypothetical protein [Amycolatopsis decaplanina]|uniref:Esterase n=1 Tax=Amycolatopsis decaplanina DSM 44594 TaxID=1284240 RepID=M2ZU04_9PSEU|nr:hypothetical protein [Amycolatopsis decaplanina]EME63839.1 esterase [Amycolatopsis decaplanina DSM 44594]
MAELIVVADPAVLGALRMIWRTADPVLKTAMLEDGTEQDFFAYLNALEPDESLDAGTERADVATWAGSRALTSGLPRTGRCLARCRTASTRRRPPFSPALRNPRVLCRRGEEEIRER